MFPKEGNKLHLQGNERQAGTRFRKAIAAALHSELGSTHQAVKTAMRWTGASDRTAKHWLAGTHGPSGEHLVDLLRNSDEVYNAVLLLADRKTTMSHASLLRLRDHLMAAVHCLQKGQ